MATPSKIPSKRLQAYWDAKLANEGLSTTLSSGNPYRSGTVNHSPVTWQAKTEYFAALGRHFHDTQFATTIDKRIMRLYANGCSIISIAKELRKTNKRKALETVIRRVRHTVRRYETGWGIKIWSLKQQGLP